MKTRLSKQFAFEAAHFLPGYVGKCAALHGHSYKLSVVVEGGVDQKSGMVIDFVVLAEIVEREIIRKYDHQLLNNFFPNPTAELVVGAFFDLLSQKINEKTVENVRLVLLRLHETASSYAEITL